MAERPKGTCPFKGSPHGHSGGGTHTTYSPLEFEPWRYKRSPPEKTDSPKKDLWQTTHRTGWGRSYGRAPKALRETEIHMWQSNRKVGRLHKRMGTCRISVPFANPLTIFRIPNHQFFLSSFPVTLPTLVSTKTWSNYWEILVSSGWLSVFCPYPVNGHVSLQKSLAPLLYIDHVGIKNVCIICVCM